MWNFYKTTPQQCTDNKVMVCQVCNKGMVCNKVCQCRWECNIICNTNKLTCNTKWLITCNICNMICNMVCNKTCNMECNICNKTCNTVCNMGCKKCSMECSMKCNMECSMEAATKVITEWNHLHHILLNLYSKKNMCVISSLFKFF
jgi:hypothetical protein